VLFPGIIFSNIEKNKTNDGETFNLVQRHQSGHHVVIFSLQRTVSTRATAVSSHQRVVTTGYQNYQSQNSQLIPRTSSSQPQQFAVAAIPMQSAVLATPFSSQTVVSTLANPEVSVSALGQLN
jgi:hypothetical protein